MPIFQPNPRPGPPEAEVASDPDRLSFSSEAGFAGHPHIAHLSTIEGLLQWKKPRGGESFSVACTLHHLLLNEDTAKDRRLYAKMNPAAPR